MFLNYLEVNNIEIVSDLEQGLHEHIQLLGVHLRLHQCRDKRLSSITIFR
jgi:hypothetical protein